MNACQIFPGTTSTLPFALPNSNTELWSQPACKTCAELICLGRSDVPSTKSDQQKMKEM
jgi:hypothetical protein